MNEKKMFKQNVKEALKCYVYALVDPRNSTIFYIGKGTGDRVFQHATAAINEIDQSLKLETIKAIMAENKEVRYYILRHNLTEEVAYTVESTLIDLLTYPEFNKENLLTNIVSGHHQWDEGIKSVEELNILYDCPKIEIHKDHKLLLVSLNRSFYQTSANGVYQRPNIYEATRKAWRTSKKRVENITHVLGVYKGIVRSVIEVNSHSWTQDPKPRCCFEGKLLENSPYLNKDVSDYPFGSRGAIRYI